MTPVKIDKLVRRAVIWQLFSSVGWLLAGAGFLYVALVPMQSGREVGLTWDVAIPGLIGLGITLTGLLKFWENCHYCKDLDQHPAFQWEAYGTPQEVRQALQQLLETRLKVWVRNVEITHDWLLMADRGQVISIYLPSTAWVYKRTTERKHYGVITTSVSYGLVLQTVDARSISLEGLPEFEVERLLVLIAERAPGAICGYSRQAQELWDKDRQAFLKTVEQRRENLQ